MHQETQTQKKSNGNLVSHFHFEMKTEWAQHPQTQTVSPIHLIVGHLFSVYLCHLYQGLCNQNQNVNMTCSFFSLSVEEKQGDTASSTCSEITYIVIIYLHHFLFCFVDSPMTGAPAQLHHTEDMFLLGWVMVWTKGMEFIYQMRSKSLLAHWVSGLRVNLHRHIGKRSQSNMDHLWFPHYRRNRAGST